MRRHAENVAGAFGWTGSALDGEYLWLVDDVLTTGATVEAAASVLSQAGASLIDAWRWPRCRERRGLQNEEEYASLRKADQQGPG